MGELVVVVDGEEEGGAPMEISTGLHLGEVVGRRSVARSSTVGWGSSRWWLAERKEALSCCYIEYSGIAIFVNAGSSDMYNAFNTGPSCGKYVI